MIEKLILNNVYGFVQSCLLKTIGHVTCLKYSFKTWKTGSFDLSAFNCNTQINFKRKDEVKQNVVKKKKVSVMLTLFNAGAVCGCGKQAQAGRDSY